MKIKSYNEIDLDNSALIEASAGTGKTYTIVHLLVKILEENENISLSNILALTFSEKAADEMKMRVRELLYKKLRENRENEKFTRAIADLDNAPILTIHGFCLRVLKENAFTSKTPFNIKIEDNFLNFRKVLYQTVKYEFDKSINGSDFLFFLMMKKFGSRKGNFNIYDENSRVNSLERICYEMYKNFAGSPYIKTNPPLYSEAPSLENKYKTDIGRGINELSEIIGFVFSEKAILREFKNKCTALFENNLIKKNQSRMKKFYKAWVKILDGLETVPDEKVLAYLLSERILMNQNENKGRAKDNDEFRYLVNPLGEDELDCESFFMEDLIPKTKAGKKDFLNCKTALIKEFKTIYYLDKEKGYFREISRLSKIIYRMSFSSIALFYLVLRKNYHNFREKNQIIDYNSMIENVVLALKNNELKNQLQNIYKFGLIDEFQDTDKMQWEIIKSLFPFESKGKKANVLFLVGDPKQSIYRFRNADLPVYLEAKRIFEKGGETGFVYQLTLNYRSHGSLVNAFNELFSSFSDSTEYLPSAQAEDAVSANFFLDDRITYMPADSSGIAEKESGVHSDHPNGEGGEYGGADIDLPGIYAVGLSGQEGNYPGEYDEGMDFDNRGIDEVYAEYIVDQIRTLIEKGIKEKEICILVRKRGQVTEFENYLKKSGFSYFFYKQKGLYESIQAINIKYLLGALSYFRNPEGIHVLRFTDFFRNSADKGEDLLLNQQFSEVWNLWLGLCTDKNWGKLFDSILRDSGLEKNLFDKSGGLRKTQTRELSVYRQIFDELSVYGYTNKSTVYDLYQFLVSRMERIESPGENEEFYKITDVDQINIMTVHAAKGLEFPYVFYGEPFVDSGPSRNTGIFSKYHDPELILDLEKTNNSKSKDRREENCEERRIFYVAATRAKTAFYFSYKIGQSKYIEKKKESGNCRHIRFTEPGGNPGKDIFPERSQKNGKSYFSDGVILSGIQSPDIKQDTANDFISLIQSKSRLKTASFSSIHFQAKHEDKEEIIPGIIQKWQKIEEMEFEERGKPQITDIISDDPGTSAVAPIINGKDKGGGLPGGVHTGLLFHAILEKIDFTKVQPSMSMDEIRNNRHFMQTVRNELEYYFPQLLTDDRRNNTDNIRSDDLKKQYIDKITEILHPVLTNEYLLPDGSVFSLSSVSDKARWSEMEFVIPVNDNSFLNGFIDLIFKYRDKIYFLDWKSNILDNYDYSSVRENMNENYSLQIEIYHLAILRWCKNYRKNFDYTKNFGGFGYLYLRGVGKNTGYVFEKYERDLMNEKLKNLLHRYFNKIGDRDEI